MNNWKRSQEYLTNIVKFAIMVCRSNSNEIYSVSAERCCFSRQLENSGKRTWFLRNHQSEKMGSRGLDLYTERIFRCFRLHGSGFWKSPYLVRIVYAFGCKNFFRLVLLKPDERKTPCGVFSIENFFQIKTLRYY